VNRINTLKIVLVLLLGLFVATVDAGEIKVYVAPDGNDANVGTIESPLATLTAARDLLREKRTPEHADDGARVIVADGRYTLTESLILEPEDGGTAGASVRYEAVLGAQPVFSGGRIIKGWRPLDNGIWAVDIPSVADGDWRFEQLFINGRRATRARTPNDFYFYMQDVDQIADGANGVQTVRMRPEDFDATFLTPTQPLMSVRTLRAAQPGRDASASITSLSQEELQDVNMMIYHKWDNTRRYIDSVSSDDSTITTSGRIMKSWNPWLRNTRFHLENFLDALDVPGEWFLSREGTLYYMPLPDEDMTKAEVIAPAVERFLLFQGDPDAGEFVEHISIEGLAFEHGQRLTPPEGFEASQAASPIEAVVMLDGAKNVTIERCEFNRFGIYGVWFRRGCSKCTLRQCLLEDFGAGGVRIGETSIASGENAQTGKILVENNIIRGGGRIFPCAVGVWIGQSADNRVVHNEIADHYYTGISVGWRWGYAESLAKRNTIAYNNVHHIGWGVLSDMGGIYTLGPSEGTIVRNNVFHDIYAYSYGGWGLYTDEGSTGILFANNLCYNTKTGGFHQHYGKENIVRNNILAFSELYQVQATRVEEHLSFTFENNIVYFDRGELLSGPWDRIQHESGRNCFWHTDESEFDFIGRSLEEWQASGHELGSRIMDPRFIAPEERDFRFRVDSQVRELGFVPFDYGLAGVQGDPEWIAEAENATFPELKIAPPPPPLTINDDFERYPVGSSPRGIELHVENKGDAIVIEEEEEGANRYVKIIDAPGLERSYNPHLVYSRLKYEQGQAGNAFRLHVKPDAYLQFEWRDYGSGGYRTGPNFTIRNNLLQLRTGQSIPLSPNAWIVFTIACRLGNDSEGVWTLSVAHEDGSTQIVPGLPYADTEFEQLNWVGFTSAATDVTEFRLDDFRLNLSTGE
jgi:hypothetical protein